MGSKRNGELIRAQNRAEMETNKSYPGMATGRSDHNGRDKARRQNFEDTNEFNTIYANFEVLLKIINIPSLLNWSEETTPLLASHYFGFMSFSKTAM